MGKRFVEVAVNAPIGPGKTLSYGVPASMDVPEPGRMVWAPLGPRPVQGIVFECTDSPQVEAVRDIISVLEPSPLLGRKDLELASWISRYYLSSLFEAASLMLPPGLEHRVSSWLSLAQDDSALQVHDDPKVHALLELMGHKEVAEQAAVNALGTGGERTLNGLINSGAIKRRWEFPRPRRRHRYKSIVHPVSAGAEQINGLSPRQKEFYDALLVRGSMDTPDTNKTFGASAVTGTLNKGLASMEWVRLEPDPVVNDSLYDSDAPPELTAEQMRAYRSIADVLDRKPAATRFLLHGVTGSGKTEVYLRALEHCISAGKRGIYLVPEISLTPQTLHRLNSRFRGKVAVLHSRMTGAQRLEQWRRIHDGEFDVVVGPRSALFAPVQDLGLIVIDEEHEWTYKQHDASPRFHTRAVAHKLAELTGAVVVAGSATPGRGDLLAGATSETPTFGTSPEGPLSQRSSPDASLSRNQRHEERAQGRQPVDFQRSSRRRPLQLRPSWEAGDSLREPAGLVHRRAVPGLRAFHEVPRVLRDPYLPRGQGTSGLSPLQPGGPPPQVLPPMPQPTCPPDGPGDPIGHGGGEETPPLGQSPSMGQ